MQEEESTEDIESLLNLAIGPEKSVARYSGCIINGIRFHTRDRDANKRTQNSGVVVKGEHRGKSIEFYGVLTDIIELSYLGENRVVVFKCDWLDLTHKKGIQVDEHQFVSVNITKTWYTNYPYALASQTQQVYYLRDTRLGDNWCVVERSQLRGTYDVLEKEVEVDDSPEEAEDPYQQEAHEFVNAIEVNNSNISLRRDDMEEIVVDLNAKTQGRENVSFIDDESDAEDGACSDENVEEEDISSDDEIDDDSSM